LFYSFFIIFGRLLVRGVQRQFFKNGLGTINIVVIGTGKNAHALAKRLQYYTPAGYNLVGFIGNGTQTVGQLKNLYKIIRESNIHEVYIADPTLSQEEILEIVAKCPDKHVRFKITSNIFELISGTIDIAHLESIPSLDLNKTVLPLWKVLVKRLFDFFLATIVFIITLPLLLVILVVISVTSEGSPILVQKRVGKDGKLFLLYKLRTMKKTAELYQKAPRKKTDQRVTPLGKLLRQTSLDELPQLVNIIKGDMSIVGPRPEMPFIVKNYSAWEKRRLVVKPGLTGLWQVLGRKDLPLSQNLEYDFYYINNQSLMLDIVIILKTIPIVLLGKGAY
jgi:exopolysaccharide biosynthesis polyprenyl glycosylphosphotransferase